MKLAIDLDGCLANFTHAFGDLLIEHTDENLLGERWKEDPAFPSTWNWHLAAGYTDAQSERAWRHVTTSDKFWLTLKPLDGAVGSLKQLNRLSKYGHDVYFITHRVGRKAKWQTEEWLETHGMEHPTVILSGNKVPILAGIDADFFIDDKLQTVTDAVAQFGGGMTVMLKDAPYNREGRPDGLIAVPSVEDALKHLELWQDPKRGRPKTLEP